MGIRGARHGNTARQIESQTKTAAAALLAVMNLLQRGEEIELSGEWASYFAAIGRRLEWIRSRTNNPAAAIITRHFAAPIAGTDDNEGDGL